MKREATFVLKGVLLFENISSLVETSFHVLGNHSIILSGFSDLVFSLVGYKMILNIIQECEVFEMFTEWKWVQNKLFISKLDLTYWTSVQVQLIFM